MEPIFLLAFENKFQVRTRGHARRRERGVSVEDRKHARLVVATPAAGQPPLGSMGSPDFQPSTIFSATLERPGYELGP